MPIMVGRPMVNCSLFLWRIKRFLKSFLIIGKMKIPANKTENEKRLLTERIHLFVRWWLLLPANEDKRSTQILEEIEMNQEKKL